MFGVGPATRIYLAAGTTDMRNYVPFIDMWSCAVQSPQLARFRDAGRRIT